MAKIMTKHPFLRYVLDDFLDSFPGLVGFTVAVIFLALEVPVTWATLFWFVVIGVVLSALRYGLLTFLDYIDAQKSRKVVD